MKFYTKYNNPPGVKTIINDICQVDYDAERRQNINEVAKQITMGRSGFMQKVQTFTGDFTGIPEDLMEIKQMMDNASEAFESMPSNIRERFANKPELMLKFINDPSNLDEGRKLGLFKMPDPPIVPQEVIVVEKKIKEA